MHDAVTVKPQFKFHFVDLLWICCTVQFVVSGVCEHAVAASATGCSIVMQLSHRKMHWRLFKQAVALSRHGLAAGVL